MHRSGTSAVARAINLLGVSLGNPEHLIGGDIDINPKGYWEYREINEIHDNILRTLSRTWNDISPMPNHWVESPEIATYKEQLTELIKVEFVNKPLWGFKEPRTCLLMPLWNGILNDLGVETNYVIVIRNPIDVANSLNKRDELSLNESLLLWQQHTLLSLTNTRGYKRVILHYDDMLRDWESALKKVSQSLSIPWPDDERKLEEEMQSFLDPNLRHSTSSLNDLQDLKTSSSIKRTYSLCLKAEENPDYLSSEEFAQKTEDMLQDFLMFSEILPPELRDSLHTKNKRIRTLQEELMQRGSQIALKDRELGNKTKLIEAKNHIIQNKDQQIQNLNQKTEELDNLIQDKDKLVSSITNTFSWKITTPFRWFGKLISGKK